MLVKRLLKGVQLIMFTKLKYSYNTVILYSILGLCMLFLNFTATDAIPFSIALYIALLFCGLPLLDSSILYLLAGTIALFIAPVGYIAYILQSLFLCGIFLLFKYLKREIRFFIVPIILIALTPFFWIYGQFVLHNYIKVSLYASILFVTTFLFILACKFLFTKLNKSQPSIDELVFTACSFIFVAMGMINAVSSTVYLAFTLFVLLFACYLSKNSNAVFTALTLAVPLAILQSLQNGSLQAQEIAYYALYTVTILLCMSFHRALATTALAIIAFSVYILSQLIGQVPFNTIWKLSSTYWTLMAIVIPCILFALIPNNFIAFLSKRWRQFHERPLIRASINHNRIQVAERLYEISAAFREIECSFLGLEHYENNPIAMQHAILHQLKSECCMSCENLNACHKEIREESLTQLIEIGCRNGKVGIIDIPNILSNNCYNTTALIFSLNKMLIEYKKQNLELEHEKQAREMIASYSKNVSEVLRELALEHGSPLSTQLQQERQIQQHLAKHGIVCTDIIFHKNPIELLISIQQNIENDRLLQLLEEQFAFPLTLVDKQYINEKTLCFRFKKRPKFDALFGIASATKNGETVSGDTHSITRINEKTFLCALADGMGSGQQAREVSDLALNLIESFYRAGMQSDTILNTVNGLLNTGQNESFACIDMATINLESGRADIIKIGSPLAFLLGQKQIEMLCSESLPLGILDGVHPTILVREMQSGDILLFLSDGVTSAFGSSIDIATYLSTLSPSNPQHLVDTIVNRALQFTNGVATDDITAVAIRLFEQKVA